MSGMLAPKELLGVAKRLLNGPTTGVLVNHVRWRHGEVGGEEVVVPLYSLGIANDDQEDHGAGQDGMPEHGS